MSNKVSAILTSDWHLREDTPICRTDDFWTTQWNKVEFIFKLQLKYNCPILHGGDLFHNWKPSPFLLTMAMRTLPLNFKTVYGQHDLPQHSLKLQEKCGIYNLLTAKKLELLNECHWGQEPKDGSLLVPNILKKDPVILVWHNLTFKNELPFPDCASESAKEILKKYPQFDLIVTGDNHQTFVEEYKGRLLVNPGSLMRQTAKQFDHSPCVFLWFAKTNKVEQVFIPIERDVISRNHVEIKEQRDQRITAFISSLNTDWDVDISLKENVEKFFSKNKVSKKTKSLIYKYLNV